MLAQDRVIPSRSPPSGSPPSNSLPLKVTPLKRVLRSHSFLQPYDGVFNGYDDLVLLKLFIRIITGCDPTLPKGTFESVGVTPDFYLIESKDLSWVHRGSESNLSNLTELTELNQA